MPEIATIKTWFGRRIKQLNENEYQDGLVKLLAQIVFVTGGKMYDKNDARQKRFYEAQIASLSEFVLNQFGFLTFKEIKQAFYLNAANKFGEIHSHYGRELNIEFIGKVLSGYTKYKQNMFLQFGNDLQKVISPEKQLAPPPALSGEELKNAMRWDIELSYRRFVNEGEINEFLFPGYYYDTLEEDEVYEKDFYKEHLHAATNKEISDTSESPIVKNPADISSILKKINLLKENDRLEEHNPIKLIAKQMAVKKYFGSMKKNGKKNIYTVEKSKA